ncbi:MAG: hypothetical protein DME94_04430 [Verrucomicrobia bacterium]|nr:MAG: hypothetical protein DME94_04430 [Verrucomicrobiota bacterium]
MIVGRLALQILRKSTPKNETTPLDYADRINRAINFVLNNLDRPIRLEQVARVACFSPFHFHRIFRSLIGESLNEFVKRVRLERALAMMSRKIWKIDVHDAVHPLDAFDAVVSRGVIHER